jgi:hypothetical protein
MKKKMEERRERKWCAKDSNSLQKLYKLPFLSSLFTLSKLLLNHERANEMTTTF